MKLFRKIIDDAHESGVKRVHLYLHGEPFIHPNIVEMVQYIKAYNLSFHITTNGMILDNDKIKALLQSGIDSSDYLVFSLLGHSKGIHEKIMKGVKQEKVINNIFEILKQRKQLRINGPVIETMFYIIPENEHEKDSFVDFWQGKVDHARVVGKISESFAKYKSGKTIDFVRQKSCPNIWERMTIFWNGDVTVCFMDVDSEHVVGNLGDKSIAELWTSSTLVNMRAIHRKGEFQKIPMCINCDA